MILTIVRFVLIQQKLVLSKWASSKIRPQMQLSIHHSILLIQTSLLLMITLSFKITSTLIKFPNLIKIEPFNFLFPYYNLF